MQLEEHIAIDGHVDETEACETRKSIHQTNELALPYSSPSLFLSPLFPTSFVSLDFLLRRFGPLYRFNGSSGTQTRGGTNQDRRDRRTNGDGETKALGAGRKRSV